MGPWRCVRNASCLSRPFRGTATPAKGKEVMTALSQAAFRALVARARYRSNLHCCAQQILAFRTDRGNSQRTEQNVLMTMARLEGGSSSPQSPQEESSAHKGQVDGQITREASRSTAAPHDSPSSIAPELPRHPTRPSGLGAAQTTHNHRPAPPPGPRAAAKTPALAAKPRNQPCPPMWPPTR